MSLKILNLLLDFSLRAILKKILIFAHFQPPIFIKNNRYKNDRSVLQSCIYTQINRYVEIILHVENIKKLLYFSQAKATLKTGFADFFLPGRP